MNLLAAILAALVVGTWNGQWFPSGRAKHRAHPDVEAATTAAAADMLRGALARFDPHGTNDIVICLNEIRDPEAASNLVAGIGRRDLSVAVISRYRWRDRFNTQQDVIATTLPVVKASWSKWRNANEETPPRGYAFASLVVAPAFTANVYAVHLKSNYGATTEKDREANRAKRTRSVKQLVDVERRRRGDRALPAVIAGDFNADCWRREFSGEKIFDMLEKAGFLNTLSLLPKDARGTYPSRKWGDSALDYIMTRGFKVVRPPVVFANDELSDHRAVFVELELDHSNFL